MDSNAVNKSNFLKSTVWQIEFAGLKTNKQRHVILQKTETVGIVLGVAYAWRYGCFTHNDTLSGFIPEQHKDKHWSVSQACKHLNMARSTFVLLGRLDIELHYFFGTDQIVHVGPAIENCNVTKAGI